jgi:hypothetical protein
MKEKCAPEQKHARSAGRPRLACGTISGVQTTTPDDLTPDKLPDPWLADSAWLLEELAKTREQVLRVPLRLDNASDIKSACDRLFNLETTLRYLLRLRSDGQSAFARKARDLEHACPVLTAFPETKA